MCNPLGRPVSRGVIRRVVATSVSRSVDVRQAAGRKNNFGISNATWWKTCCTDPTKWDKGRKKKYMERKRYVYYLIISLLPPTAGHRPLLSNFSPFRPIRGYSHPAPASHSTWPEGVLLYIYWDVVSTLELVYPSSCRFYSWYGQPTATSAC
jgi:hypothetical protein